MHAAGESIRAARGHERTPEHPRDIERIGSEARFRDYFATRGMLVRRVNRLKEIRFGDEHKFRGRSARSITGTGSSKEFTPSNAMLQWALEASTDEWIEAMTSEPDRYSFLFYH